MAVTTAIADEGSLPYYIEGSRKKVAKVFTLTGTYVSGGVDVTAANLGLNHIDYATAQIKTPANSADTIAAVDFSKTSGQAGKLVLYDASPAEITAADTVTGTTVEVQAWGY